VGKESDCVIGNFMKLLSFIKLIPSGEEGGGGCQRDGTNESEIGMKFKI
jgi:hypothetical protein